MGAKNIAYINKDMLVWAREQTPFINLEVLEIEKPNISVDKIVSWENGDDLPSVSEAKELAKIYKVPFACFYLSEIPSKKVKPYLDRRTISGTRSSFYDISYSLWSEIEKMHSDRDSIIEWFDPDMEKCDLPSLTDNGLENTAAIIRKYFDLKTPFRGKSAFGSNPFAYYRGIVESKDIIVSQISGVSLEEMRGISIYYDSFPLVGINNQDYDTSKVFSLFHELAHLFRRSSSLCTIDINENSDAEETLCNRIAAEVLMPKSSFIEMWKKETVSSSPNLYLLEKIAGKFGVSSFSVLIRLKEIGLISKTVYDELFELLQRSFEENKVLIERKRRETEFRVKYQYVYINNHGTLFPKTILGAYASGRITMGTVCKILNVKSKHVAGIEQAVMY